MLLPVRLPPPRRCRMVLLALLMAATHPTASALWPPAGVPPPALLFGPDAHHPAHGQKEHSAAETLALLSGQAGSWDEVRERIAASGGAIHISVYSWTVDRAPPEAQQQLAKLLRRHGLALSVEAGMGFKTNSGKCGASSGSDSAARDLKALSTYISSGGTVRFWHLASSFSRTHIACPNQALSVTVHEAAAYAAAVHDVLPNASISLYDALPHFAVGEAWPASPGGPLSHFGFELGAVLSQLQASMEKRGVALSGYWADCPFDYSNAYPYGDGYKKIAAAAAVVSSLGLQFGKTFNAEKAGNTSSQAFYQATLQDFARTMAVVPSVASNETTLSFVMMETWYAYPTAVAPESTPYTMANTARDMFRQIRTRPPAVPHAERLAADRTLLRPIG